VIEGMKAVPAEFAGKVVVLYGDVPLLEQKTVELLIRAVEESAAPMAAVTGLYDDPTGYGRIVREASGRVVKVVEEKDASPEEKRIKEINAGIYCFDAAFLRAALAELKDDNAQHEYYLTDVVAAASGRGPGAQTVVVTDHAQILGVNNRPELAALDSRLRSDVNRRWMLAGVTLVDPATTYISRRARIGRDTVIQPGVHLRGATTIGERCSIDVGSVITDSTIADGAEIKAYSVLEDARVGPKAVVGPYSRLRPGAEIGEEAHVGNFVELKKARLGRGAKANHLAYLGDAEIGAGSNVGAGTITCNYDGYGKYLTKIGERVFVGSNSTLVAPLELGDEVYVAAGSTVTDPVEKDALVLGRARQTVKPGRAKAIREEAQRRAQAQKKK
jgi:bifunctional UDP-N-acetylglucosamine pyrophosphorylase/glucosamine-1-phosphate N-acetyltransferase